MSHRELFVKFLSLPGIVVLTLGLKVPFHNNITGDFMVYQYRIETHLSQLFAHRENLEWLSIISVIIFEVNIVSKQKQAYLVTIFLFKFPLPSTLLLLPPALPLLPSLPLLPPALPLLPLPFHCSGVPGNWHLCRSALTHPNYLYFRLKKS